MTQQKNSPIRKTDDEARGLAATLVQDARFGALGVIDPTTQSPMVSRVATLWHSGAPFILVSELSHHTKALALNPHCSLLLGEPADRGDPLTHPRVTLQARATSSEKAAFRDIWLAAHPKAQLYYDFTDFKILRLEVSEAHLNGGFGKAFHLAPNDLPNSERGAAAPLT